MATHSTHTSKIKKRIVLLSDWFVPGYKAGGPIQSCANFAFTMRESYDISVITTDRDLGEEAPYSNVVSDTWQSLNGVDVCYLSPASLTKDNLIRIVKEKNPDFIYLNHMFSPFFVILPLWLWWRKKLPGKLILSPRGALFDSALHHKSTYPKKIIFLTLMRWLGIHRNVSFHATNEREQTAILKYFPGATTLVANNLPQATQQVYTSLSKSKGTLRIIFVARILPIKNLRFALRALEGVKGAVHFTIVGPIEDGEYWQQCNKLIELLPANIVVSYEGARSNAELPLWLQNHHLYILPTVGENFGHSIFESFLSGRPVLISDQTPWLQLQEKKIGWDLPLTDAATFTSAINQAVAWDQVEFDQWSKNAWQFAYDFKSNSAEVQQYNLLFS